MCMDNLRPDFTSILLPQTFKGFDVLWTSRRTLLFLGECWRGMLHWYIPSGKKPITEKQQGPIYIKKSGSWSTRHSKSVTTKKVPCYCVESFHQIHLRAHRGEPLTLSQFLKSYLVRRILSPIPYPPNKMRRKSPNPILGIVRLQLVFLSGCR